MNATTPIRETAPPGRVSLVLHPRRDVQHAIDQVGAWAKRTGTELAAVDDGRLPADVRRCELDELAHGCDLVLALGGDGTMLGGLRLAAPLGVPVLGANLGRLGYLTEVDGEHLPEALEALSSGAYGIEERFVLRAAWDEDGQRREQVAFNDVVLSRVPGRGQAALALHVDGQLLVRYASDGVIAATPIGSTAYSYAAGGPIVSPQTRAMIVTPDAPHGLFNRAVVLGDDERLGVEILPSSAPIALEVDGRLLVQAAPGWNVEITPNPWPALFVQLGSAGFAARARRKLGITDPAALADFDLAGHER
jgi:NAD+ kinase